jgi:hypothetical protein
MVKLLALIRFAEGAFAGSLAVECGVAGVWLMFAAACGLVATLLAFRMSSVVKPEPAMSPIKTAG